MYQPGDRVVYGMHGVCRVAGIEEKTVDRRAVSYWVLEPVSQIGASFYVPAHNAAAMAKIRPMLSVHALEELLRSEAVHRDHWIPDENRRKQYYRELISSGDREALMGMVSTLYRHRESQAAAGRKCHMCDENFLRDAEKLLISEVSVVMDLEQDQAKRHIRELLKD